MCLTCGSELMRSGGEGRSRDKFKPMYAELKQRGTQGERRVGSRVAKSSEKDCLENMIW